jgi:hypothetical protein
MMPELSREGFLLYWPGVSCIMEQIEQPSGGKRDNFTINEEMAV